MSLILDGMRRQVLTYTTSLKNGSTCRRISLYPYEYSQTFHTIRKLFQAAGVKKTDLKDGATAKLIVDTVSATAATLRTLPVPPGVSPLPDLGYLDAKDEAALVGAITSILSARYTIPILSCSTCSPSLCVSLADVRWHHLTMKTMRSATASIQKMSGVMEM